VRKLVADLPAAGNLILVTHQVSISALTGIFPVAGEMIILTPFPVNQEDLFDSIA
jgi:hypothetical protein